MIDLTALTDEELQKLASDVEAEKYSRLVILVAEESVINVIERYHRAKTRGLEDGEVSAWVQPLGAHDSYPNEYEVTHLDKVWVSSIPANVWEPGVSGWREVVTEGYPTWIQPTGAHDAYPLGAQVTHNGQDWESTAAGNVWEPGVFGWSLI